MVDCEWCKKKILGKIVYSICNMDGDPKKEVYLNVNCEECGSMFDRARLALGNETFK